MSQTGQQVPWFGHEPVTFIKQVSRVNQNMIQTR